MNPSRIYSAFADAALANQAEAQKYETFVALPFAESFRYRMEGVLRRVIRTAATEATRRRGALLKAYAPPTPVRQLRGAREITEEIVVGILEAHFFLADLTTANPNVLLEVGVALALKPTAQVILILDGDPTILPFDIKTNEVIRYDRPGAVSRIADAFLAAAAAFETEYRRRVEQVTHGLGSDAIYLLNYLGRLQRQNPAACLGRNMADQILGVAADSGLRYGVAEQQLLEVRLLRMQHIPGGVPGGDVFETRPTELGRRVIYERWPVLRPPSRPRRHRRGRGPSRQRPRA